MTSTTAARMGMNDPAGKPERMPMLMPDPMPTTFEGLLAARIGVPLPAIPAPAATPQRVEQATLSAADKQRFVDALDALNLPDQTGISAYGRLAAIHADMTAHRMHSMGGDPATDPGQQRFLPWHRVYLHQFEQLLQSIHPDLTIPYWDWTNPAEQAVPGWLATVRPTVNIPRPGPGRVTVTRFPGTRGFDLAAVIDGTANPPAPALADVENAGDFTSFASGLESIHDLVHVWVGGRRGTMAFLDRAPADPLFWMHHANIDRLWWQWHSNPLNQAETPNLRGADTIMDPWAFTETDTRDIATFNYIYA